MESVRKLFHRKSQDASADPTKSDQKVDLYQPPPGPPPGPPPAADHYQSNYTSPEVRHDGGPSPVADIALQSQSAPRQGVFHQSQLQVPAQNTGMVVGGMVGAAAGQGWGTGMVEGMVGANMISHEIQQFQRHQYYRDQALRYRDGEQVESLGGATIGSPGLAVPGTGTEGGKERSRSRSREERRLERRKARWERRAERRDKKGGWFKDKDRAGSSDDSSSERLS